jgi:hypothetical protein
MESKASDVVPTARDVWMRGLFMLLLIIGFTVGQWLLNLLALVQFLWLLFARTPNEFLARFGSSLAIWLADVGRFLTAPPTTSRSPGDHGPAQPATCLRSELPCGSLPRSSTPVAEELSPVRWRRSNDHRLTGTWSRLGQGRGAPGNWRRVEGASPSR